MVEIMSGRLRRLEECQRFQDEFGLLISPTGTLCAPEDDQGLYVLSAIMRTFFELDHTVNAYIIYSTLIGFWILGSVAQSFKIDKRMGIGFFLVLVYTVAFSSYFAVLGWLSGFIFSVYSVLIAFNLHLARQRNYLSRFDILCIFCGSIGLGLRFWGYFPGIILIFISILTLKIGARERWYKTLLVSVTVGLGWLIVFVVKYSLVLSADSFNVRDQLFYHPIWHNILGGLSFRGILEVPFVYTDRSIHEYVQLFSVTPLDTNSISYDSAARDRFFEIVLADPLSSIYLLAAKFVWLVGGGVRFFLIGLVVGFCLNLRRRPRLNREVLKVPVLAVIFGIFCVGAAPALATMPIIPYAPLVGAGFLTLGFLIVEYDNRET